MLLTYIVTCPFMAQNKTVLVKKSHRGQAGLPERRPFPSTSCLTSQLLHGGNQLPTSPDLHKETQNNVMQLMIRAPIK